MRSADTRRTSYARSPAPPHRRRIAQGLGLRRLEPNPTAAARAGGLELAGVEAGGARGGRHRRGGDGAASAAHRGGQARELLLDGGARRGAHLLGLPGRGGGAKGLGRAPRPLHGKLDLLWLLIGFYAELREFEINFANVRAYHLIL